MVALKHLFAASLLPFVTIVAAHGHGSHNDMGKDDGQMSNSSAPVDPYDVWYLPSYSGLEAHSGAMLAHMAFMVAAWFFLLPIGRLCCSTKAFCF
jgi:hypothetical protein